MTCAAAASASAHATVLPRARRAGARSSRHREGRLGLVGGARAIGGAGGGEARLDGRPRGAPRARRRGHDDRHLSPAAERVVEADGCTCRSSAVNRAAGGSAVGATAVVARGRSPRSATVGGSPILAMFATLDHRTAALACLGHVCPEVRSNGSAGAADATMAP
jgi:hypothetical protein